MFSISKKIYDYFNNDAGEETALMVVMFILGIILYCVTLWGKDHLTIPTPYWQIIVVGVPIIMFFMIEWIYIDDCKYDTTLKVWRDFFNAKLLAIVTGIYVTTLGVMLTGIIGVFIWALGMAGIEFVKWCGINKETFYIILLVIGIIIAYFIINILLGKAVGGQNEQKNITDKKSKSTIRRK